MRDHELAPNALALTKTTEDTASQPSVTGTATAFPTLYSAVPFLPTTPYRLSWSQGQQLLPLSQARTTASTSPENSDPVAWTFPRMPSDDYNARACCPRRNAAREHLYASGCPSRRIAPPKQDRDCSANKQERNMGNDACPVDSSPHSAKTSANIGQRSHLASLADCYTMRGIRQEDIHKRNGFCPLRSSSSLSVSSHSCSTLEPSHHPQGPPSSCSSSSSLSLSTCCSSLCSCSAPSSFDSADSPKAQETPTQYCTRHHRHYFSACSLSPSCLSLSTIAPPSPSPTPLGDPVRRHSSVVVQHLRQLCVSLSLSFSCPSSPAAKRETVVSKESSGTVNKAGRPSAVLDQIHPTSTVDRCSCCSSSRATSSNIDGSYTALPSPLPLSPTTSVFTTTRAVNTVPIECLSSHTSPPRRQSFLRRRPSLSLSPPFASFLAAPGLVSSSSSSSAAAPAATTSGSSSSLSSPCSPSPPFAAPQPPPSLGYLTVFLADTHTVPQTRRVRSTHHIFSCSSSLHAIGQQQQQQPQKHRLSTRAKQESSISPSCTTTFSHSFLQRLQRHPLHHLSLPRLHHACHLHSPSHLHQHYRDDNINNSDIHNATYDHHATTRHYYYSTRHRQSLPANLPTMIPRKPKYMLSLVTTVDNRKFGASRTTLSTVHGGDWDDQHQQQPVPQLQHQRGSGSNNNNRGDPLDGAGGGYDPYLHPVVEPSTPSAPDPWMIVSGAGAPARVSSAPASAASPSVLTPLQVRQQQLQALPTLQLLDRYADTDPVLDVEIAQQIRLELPRRLRNATKWNLVYSSDQHGISMTTLYHRCKGKGPMILAIKDTTDAIFGAFVSEAFKPNLSYYGTGECFLWNVTTMIPPSPAAGPTISTSNSPMPSPAITTKITPLPSPAVRSPLDSAGCSRSSSGAETSTATIGTQGPLSAQTRQDLFRAMREDVLHGMGGGKSPSPVQHHPAQLSTIDALRPPERPNSTTGSPRLSPLDTPSSTAATVGSSPPSLSTEFPPSISSSATSTPTAGGPPTSSSSRKGKRQPRPKFVQFWNWTGRNDYMMLSEPGFIGLGGGEGHFGLWIHADLEHGHSARCSTFDNEPLALACHRPVRADGGDSGTHSRTATPTPPAPAGDASPKSDSDREKFYCQTVEIWAPSL